MYIYSEEEYNPGLHLDKETTDLLSSLRASLNIDLYYLAGNYDDLRHFTSRVDPLKQA